MYHVAAKFLPYPLRDKQKSELCQSQSGVVRSFKCWWKFLKHVITGDETCMGTMLKQKCCHHSGWESHCCAKKTTKKNTSELIKSESYADYVFWLDSHCSSWACSTSSDSQQEFYLNVWSIWVKYCNKWGLKKGEKTPWQCTCSHTAPY